jgi:hypothetical protein
MCYKFQSGQLSQVWDHFNPAQVTHPYSYELMKVHRQLWLWQTCEKWVCSLISLVGLSLKEHACDKDQTIYERMLNTTVAYKYWKTIPYCWVFPKLVWSQKFPRVFVSVKIPSPLPQTFWFLFSRVELRPMFLRCFQEEFYDQEIIETLAKNTTFRGRQTFTQISTYQQHDIEKLFNFTKFQFPQV